MAVGGETVRALQDQSGARIKVDPNGDPDSPERTINIFGKFWSLLRFLQRHHRNCCGDVMPR